MFYGMAWLLSYTVYFSFSILTSLGPVEVCCGSWVNVDYVLLDWVFLFDSLTVSLLVVVLFVSYLVHLFSVDYMHSDPYFLKFISYLSLFTFFMLLLVTAGNFFQLFLGWEGVGLASYLLINFWFTRLQANKSALKAIIVNRIGDFCLYLGILLIFFNFKTLDFYTIFSCLYLFDNVMIVFCGFKAAALDLICMFLFIAAMGKSAQIGLHTWLPDAMEGPTPVSALIHAATMVTAGIFLIVRCSFLFEYSQVVLLTVTCVGALTIIFSSTAGVFQFDLKKIIAYSTCSQLGYMTFACGNSQYVLALYHLFNHAFFKALLFLGAGSIIHAVFDEQDIRKMGGLWKLLPVSYISFLLGSLSLMGLPFLTGFYSKDLILEVSSFNYNISGVFSHWLAIFAVVGTASYSTRLLYYVFFNNVNLIGNVRKIRESSSFTIFVLCVLCVFSVVVGFFVKDFFTGAGTDAWASIYISPANNLSFEEEFLPFYLRALPLLLTIFGVCLSYLIVVNFGFFFIYMLKVQRFFGAKWFFDIIYNNVVVLVVLKCAYNITFKLLDRGFIEQLGSFGFSRSYKSLAFNLSKFQSGFLYHYLLVFILSMIIMFFFVKISIFGDLYIFALLVLFYIMFHIKAYMVKKHGVVEA
jgi:NADH-ubiquinone oxidoreductase chain 5